MRRCIGTGSLPVSWISSRAAPYDVSAEFESVPVAEGLYRLLGNQNFALIYGEDGNLKAVQLLGYRPRYSSLQAVREALDWLAAHGEVPAL